jgi:hypothetical protein
MDVKPNKQRILSACGHILGPIVRFLIKGGVSWKEFSELSKVVFVQVATADFGIRGRPTNASRVAILTGLDRREVRKQRAALANDEIATTGYMTKASQVLGGWHQDPIFTDASHQPLALPLDGATPCVADLVRSYAPGLPAVAMLKELKAAGAVEEQSKGIYRPLTRSYIPKQMSDEQLRLWSSTVRDLSSAVGHNLTRPVTAPALFERRAVNLHVDSVALPAFRAFLEAEAQAFLVRADDWLAAHVSPAHSESAGKGQPIRVGVGIYQIQDNPNDK